MAKFYLLFIFLTFCYLCLFEYHLYHSIDLMGSLLHPAGTLLFYLFFRWAWGKDAEGTGH